MSLWYKQRKFVLNFNIYFCLRILKNWKRGPFLYINLSTIRNMCRKSIIEKLIFRYNLSHLKVIKRHVLCEKVSAMFLQCILESIEDIMHTN